MKKMYKQPEMEIAEVVANQNLLGGSATITDDPDPEGPGIGGGAPERRGLFF